VDECVATVVHFDGDRIVREWVSADKLGCSSKLRVVDNPWPG